MTTFLISALGLLILAFLWMSWRYFTLRRDISSYAQTIRRAANGDLPPLSLLTEQPSLDSLSAAVNALNESWDVQLNGLDAERARLAAVLEQLTDGVLIADASGKVQFSNPAANALFNKGSTLLGYSVTEAIRHHQLVEAWRICQQTRTVQSESVEIPSTNQLVQLIAIPDQFAGGSLLLIQDLTRIRRLETVRRDFISNLSHEIRTPLASLKAIAETLQAGALDDPPAARRFINSMETEVDALTQMANELLELSRIESGQISLTLKRVKPLYLLNRAVERMQTQLDRAELKVHISVEEALPDVHADMPRIEQVLVNLLHNAIKFTKKGGDIHLSAKKQAGLVCFLIKDSGQGISAEDLPRIFERFYKTDRARTKGSVGGTGLGLSIAKHIIETHNGKIWAESIEGQGSTFYFTLPTAS